MLYVLLITSFIMHYLAFSCAIKKTYSINNFSRSKQLLSKFIGRMASTTSDEKIKGILEFYLPVNEQGIKDSGACFKLWFAKNLEFDQTLRNRFVGDWQVAMNGGYADWENTSKGSLALVVLLDQFSRNMFRGNAGSFSSDPKALLVTKNAISRGLDMELTPIERMLLYMPLMHSESFEDHENFSIPKFSELVAADSSLSFAATYEKKHADIIRQWGRYPHRNAILGRESTPEEIEFLKTEGSSF